MIICPVCKAELSRIIKQGISVNSCASCGGVWIDGRSGGMCPKCAIELQEMVKHGISIDFCASCGGIWLDKGEFSKMVYKMKESENELNDEFVDITQILKGRVL